MIPKTVKKDCLIACDQDVVNQGLCDCVNRYMIVDTHEDRDLEDDFYRELAKDFLDNTISRSEFVDIILRRQKEESPSIASPPEGCCDYLTPGKEYDIKVLEHSAYFGYHFQTVNDDGGVVYANQYRCPHLNGKDWIIKQQNYD